MKSQYKIKCLRLEELREIYRRLFNGKLNDELIELRKEILELDSQIKKANKSVGSFTTPYGNYNKAIG